MTITYLNPLIGREMSDGFTLFYKRSSNIKVIMSWNGWEGDMKLIWNPTYLELDNVWPSPKFCGERIQISCLNMRRRCRCHFFPINYILTMYILSIYLFKINKLFIFVVIGNVYKTTLSRVNHLQCIGAPFTPNIVSRKLTWVEDIVVNCTLCVDWRLW